MKNRILNNGNSGSPKTVSETTLAFMKKIEPYVLGVKVSVIVNKDHGFAFQNAESNIVNDALLGMELRPTDETIEDAQEEAEKGVRQGLKKRRPSAGHHGTADVLPRLVVLRRDYGPALWFLPEIPAN